MFDIKIKPEDFDKVKWYLELSDDYIEYNYDGPGGYSCLAIRASIADPNGPWRFLAALHAFIPTGDEDDSAGETISLTIEDYFDIVRATTIETKGTGVIVYWPGVKTRCLNRL
ncbi:hypothetical protein GCM10010149_88450 [Nonomuraea roseoviolacea subsp. roseoviolacea]|uniref:hypothetical protein n=1 Tax=Nonomuraea roseoviolacea TaxID=103837 RepID=UPI0031D0F754